jgi:transposase
MARPSLHKTRPRGTVAVTERAREAHALYGQGWHVSELAEHYGVSTNAVSGWIEKVDAALADERNLRALGIAHG